MSSEKIKPESIATSPMERGGQSTVPVGHDPLRPDPIYAQRLGLIGRLVGGGSEKPGNIATLALIFGLLIVCAGVGGLFYATAAATIEGFRHLVTAGCSLASAALGFVVGQSRGSDQD